MVDDSFKEFVSVVNTKVNNLGVLDKKYSD
jgi:hypothetical protein